MSHNENKGSSQGSQQGQGAADQAKRMAAEAAEKAKDMASSAAETARGFAHSAKEQAEAGTASLGSGIRNLASSLRENAPHEGMMGSAASGLADRLDRGGHYLEEEGLGGLANDMSTLIRRNPLPAVLIGVGIGFIAAHMCRSER
jgi:hypothetical protein